MAAAMATRTPATTPAMEDAVTDLLPGWGGVGRDEEGLDPIRPLGEGLPAHSQQARAARLVEFRNQCT